MIRRSLASGRVRFALGLIIAGFFGWLTLRSVDLGATGRALAQIGAGQWLLGCLCLGAGYLLRIRRWLVLLRAFNPRARYRDVAGPFMGSFAINNVVPLRGGDVVRTFLYERQIGVVPSRVAATLVMERLLDLLTLLLFLSFGLAVIDLVDPLIRDVALTSLGVSIFALLLVLVAPRHAYRLIYALYRRPVVRRSPALPKILRFAMRMTLALPRLSQPGRFLRLCALSLASWTLEVGVFVAAALQVGIGGIGALSAAATSTLMTMVPGTPGHLGTFDFGAKLGYMAAGLDPASATAAALAAHVMVWLPVTAVGGAWLFLRTGADARLFGRIKGGAHGA